MDVSDVLRDRLHEPAGLQRMVAVSVSVHVVVAVLVMFAPAGFLGKAAQPPRTVMTISLGGGGGPSSGGATALTSRGVQEVAPKAPREAVRPPAAKTPEMTIPKKEAKPSKATPSLAVSQAPDEARGKTPTKGAKTSAGNAVAETAVERGQGFGLSTGGGQGGGSTLDVADFCCPEYIQIMLQRIRSIWNQNQNAAGECIIKFTIQRDGMITNHEVERSSGDPILDSAARRAVATARQLPPLPTQFPNPTLTVHLNFQYQR
jgi:TonB family protein